MLESWQESNNLSTRWWPFSEPPRHRADGPAQSVHTLARHDHAGMFAPGCPWCQPQLYARYRARHKAEETA
jgi:hypothetical protein